MAENNQEEIKENSVEMLNELNKQLKEEEKNIKKQMKENKKRIKEAKKNKMKTKKVGGKKIITIFIITTLVAAIAIGGMIFINSKNRADSNKILVYDLIKSTYNLRDSNSFAMIKISISYQGVKNLVLIEGKMPQIKDILVEVIGDKTPDDIDTSNKREALKDEIIKRLNEELEGDIVKEVYFEEFIIQ